MAGDSSDGLMREIDEALRQEKLQRFFRLFGSYIILVSAIILFATIGYVWWQNHLLSSHEALTEKLHEAISLVEEGKSYQARTLFDELATQSDTHIALLAGMWRVKLKYMAGKPAEAQEIMTVLEKKYGNERDFLPYVEWLKLHHSPTQPNQTYHLSTQEMQAISYMEQKKFDKALPILEQMIKDPALPETMRDRVKKLHAFSNRHHPAHVAEKKTP